MANSIDPDQTAPFRSSLIWVYTVCIHHFVRTLVYEILWHLPYFLLNFNNYFVHSHYIAGDFMSAAITVIYGFY